MEEEEEEEESGREGNSTALLQSKKTEAEWIEETVTIQKETSSWSDGHDLHCIASLNTTTKQFDISPFHTVNISKITTNHSRKLLELI